MQSEDDEALGTAGPRYKLPTDACYYTLRLPGGSDGKESALQCRRPAFNPQGKIPEKGMATLSSIFVWRILWTRSPAGCHKVLQKSMGLQKSDN